MVFVFVSEELDLDVSPLELVFVSFLSSFLSELDLLDVSLLESVLEGSLLTSVDLSFESLLEAVLFDVF